MMLRKLNNRLLILNGLAFLIVVSLASLVYEGFAYQTDMKEQIKEDTIKFSNTHEINQNEYEYGIDTLQKATVGVIDTVTTNIDNNINRENIINSKVDSFVTIKTLNETDVIKVEPVYDENNKLFISSRAEAMCLDIRTKSNWTANDFYEILNPEMYDLVPVAIRLEDEVGVNALYIIAVGANETGWGKHMAGDYNYFNWTNDAIYHFDFKSIEDFADFSVNTYKQYYTHESFYKSKLGFIPEYITPEVVNVKYALNNDNTTNWQWSNVVSEIMSDLCSRKTN